MIWTHLLVTISGLSAGWLLGRRGVHRCIICFQPLPRVHENARCGGTPGGGR